MGKDTELQRKMKAMGKIINFVSQDKVDQWENERKKSIEQAKEHILKQPPEQQLFSFMPTDLTRTSPFFPMNRREMSDRPFESLKWVTSWGQITIEGRRLAVYDESILLVLLSLAIKKGAGTFLTTQNEICKILGVNPATDTYNAIWKSIDRLTGTKISLETWKGKGRSRQVIQQMAGAIIAWGGRDKTTGKLKIVFNPYFTEMYAESFITHIDLKFRQSLKGDPAKALYRFYRSQKGHDYSCHIMTLAVAVNLNTELPLFKLRERIRSALRELKAKRFLAKWTMNKDNIVYVLKFGKKPKLK